MAQHDYVIANQTFPNTRTDLNSAFAASVSQNSGASAPSTTYAYQLWYDTGNDILKMRNADDDAWIDLFTVDQTADTATAPSVAAGSNLLINGNMAVNQRGSVNTSDGNTVYGLDRMAVFLRGGPAATITQDTDVPSGQGFGYSNKIDVTTGDALGTANDFCLFRQKIEGQNLQQLKKGTSSAESLTLSFWIKSTITGTYVLEIRDQTNARDIHKTYTISSSNTWEYKTLTFEGDTTGAIDNDNTSGLEVSWFLGQGTDYTSGTLNTAWASAVNANRAVGQVNAVSSASNNILITGVQLEVGSVANPVFQQESFGETLQKCQRYFTRIPRIDGSSANTEIANGMGNTTNNFLGVIHFPTEMRANPTLTASGSFRVFNGGTLNPTAGPSRSSSSTVCMGISLATGGGISTLDALLLTLNNDSDANLQFSAEL